MKIKLTQNKYAIVDNQDFDLVSQYKWCYDKKGYAIKGIKKGNKFSTIYMHRVILNPPQGCFTDHINGNKLDNRRENLRICTNQQNIHNSKIPKHNTSGFKGASFDKSRNKWISMICINKKQKNLGRFNTTKEAAEAYDQAAKQYFGEFGRFNYAT